MFREGRRTRIKIIALLRAWVAVLSLCKAESIKKVTRMFHCNVHVPVETWLPLSGSLPKEDP